jgi:small GTP-binding protein
MSEDEGTIKLILLGNSGVGKTSLIKSISGINPNKTEEATLSAYYLQKPFKIEDKEYLIDLWDTAGQEAYLGVTKLFFKGSQIIIFVYDITVKNSFNSLTEWIKNVKEIVNNDYVCGIIGNKSDLFLKSQVSNEEAKNLAETEGYKFKLASAVNDPKSFEDLIFELFQEYKLKFGNPGNPQHRRHSVRLDKGKVKDTKDGKTTKGRGCC